MIIKTMSRKSNPSQLITYALRYSMREKKAAARNEHTVVLVKHNLRGNSIEGFIQQYKENESFRLRKRKDSVVLYHSILSFSPKSKEHITKSLLKDISKKFIELRAPDALHLAVAHFEKSHIHAHVISSGVLINGKSARVSKQEYNRILAALEQYQEEKYPQLVHSKSSHTKTTVLEKDALLQHFKATRKSKKLELHDTIHELLNCSKTKEEFRQKLISKGYTLYSRNENIQGVISAGKKYRYSSLGFDSKDFEKLKATSKEEKEILNELNLIRQVNDEKCKAKSHHVIEEQEKEIQDELESIQSIRRRSKERSGQERELDNGGILNGMNVTIPTMIRE